MCFISGIKGDIEDNTISFPLLACAPLNLDFDGDEGNILLLIEQALVKHFNTIHAKEIILSKHKLEVSTMIKMSTPINVCLNSWLLEEQKHLDSIGYDYNKIPTRISAKG